MTDELIKQLREEAESASLPTVIWKAIDRIEQLEAALRDQFAMAALTGIITNPIYDQMTSEKVAEISYLIADAMLESRKKKKDE